MSTSFKKTAFTLPSLPSVPGQTPAAQAMDSGADLLGKSVIKPVQSRVGQAAGWAGKWLTSPIWAPVGLAAKGVASAARAGAGALWGSLGRAPGTTLLVGLGGVMGGRMMLPEALKATPEQLRAAAQRADYGWGMTPSYGKTALASAKFTGADSARVDSYRSVLEKQAGAAAVGLNLSPKSAFQLGAALALGGTLVGAGQQALAYSIGRAGEGVSVMGRDRQYRQMMDADKTLKDYPRGETRRFFNILHRASPYLASEPVLAAGTVRTMLDAPRPEQGSVPALRPGFVRELLDIESSRQRSRFPMSGATQGSAQGPKNPIGGGDLAL